MKARKIALLPDAASMEDLASSVAHLPYTAWLDSSLPMADLGRFSFLGWEPWLVLTSRGRECVLQYRSGTQERIAADPLKVLREILQRHREDPLGGFPPFLSGGIGYLAYELGRLIEKLPGRAVDDLELPEIAFGFYDQVVAHDHVSGETWLSTSTASGEAMTAEERWERARKVLAAKPPTYQGNGDGRDIDFTCGFTRPDYLEAVRRVKEYILAGDIYQANLSQRFSAPVSEHPWILYRRLRHMNAAPFSAYLNFGPVQVCSSSPERFVRIDGDRVETRPIKGTRHRGRNAEEDRRLAEELLASTKDRAELSMIVDLERNDLGRVCSYGSVQVEEHAVIESYATVHHLVSTVTGKLHPGRDVVDLLRASFPGGSITGAPKIRSMEIIDELEPTARSVYTGCIGYLGFDGNVDMNIAIRTMLVKGSRAFFQVGGGIVADSVPEDEYQETLDKGEAIFHTLQGH